MSEASRAMEHSSPREGHERIVRQKRSFRDLLAYVWEHSAFYRDYYQSHRIRERHLADISVRDLPFMTKKELMDNFNTAVTDPRLQHLELQDWLQDSHDPYHAFREDLIVFHSSGSSGHAAVFAYDRTAWRAMSSVLTAYLPTPHSITSRRIKIAFYMATHAHFAGIATALRMPASVYDVLILSLLDTPEHVIHQLNLFQPDRLSGYSSSITQLAAWAVEGRLTIRPGSIVVSGDLLTASMGRSIDEAWGAPIYNLYTAAESLYLAVQRPGHEEMTIIDELNILEILGEGDGLVAPGEQGRVVLTNLYNYTLPILRYELGDYVVRGTSQHNGPLATIRNISGRVNDALPVVLENGDHETLNPVLLAGFYAAGLEAVQFISLRPDHVQIDYVASRTIDDAIGREFQRLLALKAASRTSFVVRRVHRLATDAKTGKRPLVRAGHPQRA